jgi:hypothetical protein
MDPMMKSKKLKKKITVIDAVVKKETPALTEKTVKKVKNSNSSVLKRKGSFERLSVSFCFLTELGVASL